MSTPAGWGPEPSPAQVWAHAETHTFRRDTKNNWCDPPMPAFGLWMHRNTKATIESNGYPIIVLLRRIGDRVECETRAGKRPLPRDGEWRPLNVNCEPTNLPEAK